MACRSTKPSARSDAAGKRKAAIQDTAVRRSSVFSYTRLRPRSDEFQVAGAVFRGIPSHRPYLIKEFFEVECRSIESDAMVKGKLRGDGRGRDTVPLNVESAVGRAGHRKARAANCPVATWRDDRSVRPDGY